MCVCVCVCMGGWVCGRARLKGDCGGVDRGPTGFLFHLAVPNKESPSCASSAQPRQSYEQSWQSETNICSRRYHFLLWRADKIFVK